MKKILLILSVFVAFNASAQLNNSSIVTSPAPLVFDYNEAYLGPIEKMTPVNKRSRMISGWMSYVDANFITGLQTATLYPVYPDSNLYIPNGNPNPFNWYVHMLGTSFDPTSQKFYDGLLGYVPPGGGQIEPTTSFTIDSILVVGVYRRRVAQTDQMVVEIGHTGTSSSTILQYQGAFAFDNFGLTDSILRFATPEYDWNNNKMMNPDATITKTLDLAAANDTTANGLNEYALALPSPLVIPAGEKVVATVRFVSGSNFPLGTDIDSANYWSHYCAESNGMDSYATPYTGEYVSGLIGVTGQRYNTDPVAVNGMNYLPATYAYTAPAGFDEPYFSFHVECPTCLPISTDDLAKEFGAITIYPNPVQDNLNIDIADIKTNDVNVAVYSMTGKKLVSDMVKQGNTQVNIDIAALPIGIYVVELESNGLTYTTKITKK